MADKRETVGGVDPQVEENEVWSGGAGNTNGEAGECGNSVGAPAAQTLMLDRGTPTNPTVRRTLVPEINLDNPAATSVASKAGSVRYRTNPSLYSDSTLLDASWVLKQTKLWRRYLYCAVLNMFFGLATAIAGIVVANRVAEAATTRCDVSRRCSFSGGLFSPSISFVPDTEGRRTVNALKAELCIFSFLIGILAVASSISQILVCVNGTKKAVLRSSSIVRVCSMLGIFVVIAYLVPLFQVFNYFCGYEEYEIHVDLSQVTASERICNDLGSGVIVTFLFAILGVASMCLMFSRRKERYFRWYCVFALFLWVLTWPGLILGFLTTMEKFTVKNIVDAGGVFDHKLEAQMYLLFRGLIGTQFSIFFLNFVAAVCCMYVALYKNQIVHTINFIIAFTLFFCSFIVAAGADYPHHLLQFFCELRKYPIHTTTEADFYAKRLCHLKPYHILILVVSLVSCLFYGLLFFFYLGGYFCWLPRVWKPVRRVRTPVRLPRIDEGVREIRAL